MSPRHGWSRVRPTGRTPRAHLAAGRAARLALLALVLLVVTGCFLQPTVIPPGVKSPFTGYASALYGADTMWLCRPDLPSNPCSANLDATELRPDGSRVVVPYAPAKDPGVDCFYVYPTVDLDPNPGNHTNFRDTTAMRRVTLSQAARFQEVCRLYVPLYRQITVGTYAVSSAWSLDQRLEIAFSDVADAFAHYLGQYNHGRKIVVIGHSQGAYMTVELLRRFFDRDPVLRPRLLAGFPIGGRVEVPPGERVGGTFANLPLCEASDETGCVVAFRAYREGANVAGDAHGPPRGLETGCVHPSAAVPDARAPLSRSYFATARLAQDVPAAVEGIQTPFVLVRGMYAARCAPGAAGYSHLEIGEDRAPGDKRPALFNPMEPRYEESTLGLHVLEMSLVQGDLIDLVGRKANAATAP